MVSEERGETVGNLQAHDSVVRKFSREPLDQHPSGIRSEQAEVHLKEIADSQRLGLYVSPRGKNSNTKWKKSISFTETKALGDAIVCASYG